MGMGNGTSQRVRRDELHERVLELEFVRERIAAEVVAAAVDVASYRRQMEIAEEAIVEAQQSYRLNNERTRDCPSNCCNRSRRWLKHKTHILSQSQIPTDRSTAC